MARITKISRCSAVCRALCNTVKIFLRAAPASTISHASLSLSPTLFSARMKNTRKRPSGQEESRVRAATMKRIYRGEHKLDLPPAAYTYAGLRTLVSFTPCLSPCTFTCARDESGGGLACPTSLALSFFVVLSFSFTLLCSLLSPFFLSIIFSKFYIENI